MCSTLTCETSNDYPLSSACRYYNRPSALPNIHSALSGDTPTDYPLCSTLSSDTPTTYPLCFSLLCLSSLQPTIRSARRLRRYRPVRDRATMRSLSSVYRYYNRLSTVLLCSLSLLSVLVLNVYGLAECGDRESNDG
jgi:hypothetical protein